MKRYIVEAPIHGYQTYMVEANSAIEAKQMVNNNHYSIKPIDGIITKHSKATIAVEDIDYD